ncbi:MAG TPA: RraA family protein [Devosia sp.]|nr:RraA family protein [Devosia sp.]
MSAGLLDTIRQHLFTAVIGDVMDAAGLAHQFLPPYLRPLDDSHLLVGRALTVLESDIADRDPEDEPFGLMFKALDDLKPGEVYVCTGSTGAFALWGELMSSRAARLGATGAVVDGFHRDTRGIRRLGFPVFSAGAYAQDQRPRGRVTDFRVPLTFSNGAVVRPGDVIVGDVDGVLAIPADHVGDIVAAALAKAGAERDVERAIAAGEATTAIFARTGIM